MQDFRHKSKKTCASGAAQQYRLFPNPNDGSFKLRQLTADNEAVNITVQDVTGRTIYSQSVQFTNKTCHVQLGQLPAGMYILQVEDKQGKRSNYKFVIQ